MRLRPSMPSTPRLLLLLLAAMTTKLIAVNGDDEEENELDAAASLFSGPLEVVVEHSEFQWLESPLWSDSGQYLLFSDVKWLNDQNGTCGMIWKWDIQNEELIKFIPCSGLMGPPPPASITDNNTKPISDYIEAGSNGLHWGWKGDTASDLLICQHGRHRIVRINLDDVVDGTIDPMKVIVIADKYNDTKFNSPNDMTLLDDGTLYFTDPPFGLQYYSAGDDPIQYAFDNLNTDVAVYMIQGEPQVDNTPVEPTRIINFGKPNDPWHAPNGVAVTNQGDIVTPITSFADPRFHVYTKADQQADGTYADSTPSQRLESTYRIEGNNSDFPALNDGLTYWKEMDILFAAGPAGIYIINGTSSPMEQLGLLRIDDLVSNTEVGGGYLWITANQRLVRIPLAATAADVDTNTDADTDAGTGTGTGDQQDSNTTPDNSSSDTSITSRRWTSIMLVMIGSIVLVSHSMEL